MKKIFFLITILLFMVYGCNKDQSDIVDVGIQIYLQDKNGNDLLNPTSVNTYNNQNIKIFYNNNNEVSEYFCSQCTTMQNGYEILIYPPANSNYAFVLSPNINIQNNSTDPVTYIQWNETDRDTIQCHIDRDVDAGSIICTKVWYNGVLKCDGYGERIITITKEE